jgi:hypothetical protein
MPENRLEPSEIVIWGAAGLLSVLLGIVGAFYLWTGLRDVEHVTIVPLLVTGLGGGILMLGLASKRYLVKAVIVLFAVTLVVSYIVGSPSFAHLV